MTPEPLDPNWLSNADSAQQAFVYLGLFYEGPWERAMNWCYAIDWRTNGIWRIVPEGSFRLQLGNFCDKQHIRWKRRWAKRYPRLPHRHWKRRPIDEEPVEP